MSCELDGSCNVMAIRDYKRCNFRKISIFENVVPVHEVRFHTPFDFRRFGQRKLFSWVIVRCWCLTPILQLQHAAKNCKHVLGLVSKQ